MPRTKLGDIYGKPKHPKPKPNYWRELVKAAYKARGWTSAELAEALDENESTTRGRINKQPSMWKIADIYKYCDVLHIDRDEAFAVILKSG